MTHDPGNRQSRFRRLAISTGSFLLLLTGAGCAWTFTPSYSLYRIKQALEAHDYAAFSHYVDVDSVLDHALDEFVESKEKNAEEPGRRGSLARALRKGFLKNFARDARDVVKAGLEIAVEQAVKDRDHPLPEIPAFAVIGALWYKRADGDTASFPVKVKKGKQIEIKARQTPEGLWRVVEVANLPALLPTLKSHHTGDQPENG
ncbi:MAG: DUF2939 domain-containing protein [Deltaproteobacteria bacterium]|nr:DUF2939 domain-containing protein [Deltaproteobacteria bacterium]